MNVRKMGRLVNNLKSLKQWEKESLTSIFSVINDEIEELNKSFIKTMYRVTELEQKAIRNSESHIIFKNRINSMKISKLGVQNTTRKMKAIKAYKEHGMKDLKERIKSLEIEAYGTSHGNQGVRS